MSSYLLLRNNKESGPYSLEALLQMGLKPYDLIWVEGRSAAWRYPGELEELKPYAPPVEEQPFDRFFRKPAPAPDPVPSREEPVAPAPPASTPARGFSDYESRFIPAASDTPRKAVVVTMPGNFQAPAAQATRQVAAMAQAARTIQAPQLQPMTPVREEKSADIETKYSQPLDDIKEMYVRTLQDRNQRASRRNAWRKHGQKVAIVLALVGAGVLLGFAVTQKGEKDDTLTIMQQAEQERQLAMQNNPGEHEPVEKMPADAADPGHTQDLTTHEETKSMSRLEKPDPNIVYRDETPETATPPKAVQKKQKEASAVTATDEGPNYGYEPSTHNNTSGERGKAVRDARNEPATQQSTMQSETTKKSLTEEVSAIPPVLAGMLKVTSNDYKRVAFGGIRDLRITVSNESSQSLQKVIVELQYLKPSEEPLKTELVSFRGIGPNESATIRVPDTNRGIKVKYKIIGVEQ